MIRRFFVLLLIGILSAPFLARGVTALLAHGRIYTAPDQISPRRAAIVFGAGVRNGRPSAVLYDRVATAVALYEAGAVDKLLMSGDSRFANYDEPAVMRQTALRLGVPDADIVLDFAGRSTYETCYRARDIFGVRDVVLVTQRYHLDRAIFTCNALGLDAVGYPAERRSYRGMTWFQIRELGATLNAFLQLFVTRPQPASGERQPIE